MQASEMLRWGVEVELLSGFGMDIGGTRARIYEFVEGALKSRLEIDLPVIDSTLDECENSGRRVRAITRLVKYFSVDRQVRRIATACAGRKDPDRKGVTLLHFAVPLPNLTDEIRRETGLEVGPLYDDDVAAAWGHLVSSQSPLGQRQLNSLLLTAGTGLAESHWVDGSFVDKASYPRACDLGFEEKLRAEGWRESGNPCQALIDLVELRRSRYPLEQLILSGRFVHMDRECLPYLKDRLSLEVHLVELSEAPALGALHMLQASLS
jgi:hypothetical protein